MIPPRDTIMQQAAAATGNGTEIYTAGLASLTMQISGTFSATVTFEATVDNTNWVAVPAQNITTGKVASTATGTGLYLVSVSGLTKVRARISAYSSGNVTVHGFAVDDVSTELYAIDSATYALTTITYPHHEIHGGSAYFAVYSALANDTDAIEVRIQTPDTTKWAHMIIEIESALAATAELWYPTTKTHAAGTAITPMNRDHNSTNTSGLTICHTPGGAQAGTANLVQYIGASASGGRVAEGGGSDSRHEFILDQNNDYLIKATSRADSNAMSIILDWYEHTNRV